MSSKMTALFFSMVFLFGLIMGTSDSDGLD